MDTENIRLRQLFSPFTWRKLSLKNRIIQTAMLTRFLDDKGYMTNRYIDFMVARAKGGSALLVSESAYLTPNSHYRPNQMACYDDSYIPGLRELVEAVHAFDCKIALQLMHAGRRLAQSHLHGAIPVAPSAISDIATGVIPHELSEEEIENLIEVFGRAAKRALESGFDAVDVHGAHGYLINQFCSPFDNKRNDRFGGTPQKRVAFACGVVRKIRKYVGPDFPILYRLQADDFIEGGIKVEEAKIHARMLQEAGVDILNVTGGNREALDMHVQPNLHPRGCLLHLAKEIKGVVDLPIIAVGRIVDPFQAEKILEDGVADLIGMARAHLADPEFANKAKEGRYEEINQCIGCMMGCLEKDFKKRPQVNCAVNPACGREREFEIGLKPAKEKKKVVVIGGGPGGMSTAWVASRRGHEVSIYEKGDALGGQIPVISVYNGKYELKKVSRWYENEFKNLGVHVHLNREVTSKMLRELSSDVVIVATGAKPIIPDVPGTYRENVVTAIDVLTGKCAVGDRVVVIGGGMAGIETAFYLAEKGKKVSIVEMLSKIGLDIGLTFRLAYWRKIPLLGIQVYTEAKLFEVRENGVNVVMKLEMEHLERKGDELLFIPADTVVLAVGLRPERTLMKELEGKIPKVYEVGDCVEPLKIIDAIHEGARVGLEI
jgi:2,4-dienoyl-CoA reductase-like NADH-dependent reductase (Old Yellow Enzyme family)/thioredoxin reductase